MTLDYVKLVRFICFLKMTLAQTIVFNLSVSFNPGLIRLAPLREFILETVVFGVECQRWGRQLLGTTQQLNGRRLEAVRHGILQPLSKQPKASKALHEGSLVKKPHFHMVGPQIDAANEESPDGGTTWAPLRTSSQRLTSSQVWVL